MRLSDRIYKMMQQSRKRIIETMRERNITKVDLVMTQEEFAKENGFDDVEDAEDDYNDYMSNDAPWVIYWDKWGNGRDYAALSVELKINTNRDDGSEHPDFKLNCYNNENGSDWFYDYDVTNLSMLNVYERMLEELGLKEEPEKIWLVKQESNDDGEIHFFVKACRDKTTAVSILQEWKDALLTKHPKYVDAKPYIDGEKDPDDQMCCYEWEDEDDDSFYIKVLGDDYHELLTIEEKEII